MRVFGLAVMVLLATGCQEGKDNPEVEEINVGPNAGIIRNPVTADRPADTSKVARLVFDHEVFDFGEVDEGVTVEHTFAFTNDGAVPLVINDARSTCGCTVPEWPKDPIPPGEQGRIRVRFDTENKINQQNKPITITANTLPSQTRIYLRGFVVPSE